MYIVSSVHVSKYGFGTLKYLTPNVVPHNEMFCAKAENAINPGNSFQYVLHINLLSRKYLSLSRDKNVEMCYLYREHNTQRCIAILNPVWHLCFRLAGQFELIENKGNFGFQ